MLRLINTYEGKLPIEKITYLTSKCAKLRICQPSRNEYYINKIIDFAAENNAYEILQYIHYTVTEVTNKYFIKKGLNNLNFLRNLNQLDIDINFMKLDINEFIINDYESLKILHEKYKIPGDHILQKPHITLKNIATNKDVVSYIYDRFANHVPYLEFISVVNKTTDDYLPNLMFPHEYFINFDENLCEFLYNVCDYFQNNTFSIDNCVQIMNVISDYNLSVNDYLNICELLCDNRKKFKIIDQILDMMVKYFHDTFKISSTELINEYLLKEYNFDEHIIILLMSNQNIPEYIVINILSELLSNCSNIDYINENMYKLSACKLMDCNDIFNKLSGTYNVSFVLLYLLNITLNIDINKISQKCTLIIHGYDNSFIKKCKIIYSIDIKCMIKSEYILNSIDPINCDKNILIHLFSIENIFEKNTFVEDYLKNIFINKNIYKTKIKDEYKFIVFLHENNLLNISFNKEMNIPFRIFKYFLETNILNKHDMYMYNLHVNCILTDKDAHIKYFYLNNLLNFDNIFELINNRKMSISLISQMMSKINQDKRHNMLSALILSDRYELIFLVKKLSICIDDWRNNNTLLQHCIVNKKMSLEHLSSYVKIDYLIPQIMTLFDKLNISQHKELISMNVINRNILIDNDDKNMKILLQYPELYFDIIKYLTDRDVRLENNMIFVNAVANNLINVVKDLHIRYGFSKHDFNDDIILCIAAQSNNHDLLRYLKLYVYNYNDGSDDNSNLLTDKILINMVTNVNNYNCGLCYDDIDGRCFQMKCCKQCICIQCGHMAVGKQNKKCAFCRKLLIR